MANWHCCNYIQILLHTKATHITKKKTRQYFHQLFSTRKKEYKTYTFLRSIFFQPVGDRISPTFKGNSIVFFLLVFIVLFFFFFTSKRLCRHHKLWWICISLMLEGQFLRQSQLSKNEKQNPYVFLAESSICNVISISTNTQCPKATREWKTRAASSSKIQGKTWFGFPPSAWTWRPSSWGQKMGPQYPLPTTVLVAWGRALGLSVPEPQDRLLPVCSPL